MAVVTERNGSVLWVRIDRPSALNAVDFEVMQGLEQALAELAGTREFRVLVLMGAGEQAFISGGDLKAFSHLVSAEEGEAMARRMHAILNGLEAVDAWTIAAVNGDAFGGGCETLLACDFRVAAVHARFGFTQGRFHLPPGWGGLTRLVELVGRPRALRWLGTQALVGAEEALQAGLLDQVVPPEELREEVALFAERLARESRALIGALKQGALRAHQMPRTEAIAAELAPFGELWGGEEHLRRVEAFLNRPRGGV